MTNEHPEGSPARAVVGSRGMGTAATLGLAGLAVFVVITVLVQLGLLHGVDRSVATSMQYVESPTLDWWTTVAGELAVAEMSVVYGVVLSLILWRAGAGRWSLAPFAFLVPSRRSFGGC